MPELELLLLPLAVPLGDGVVGLRQSLGRPLGLALPVEEAEADARVVELGGGGNSVDFLAPEFYS